MSKVYNETINDMTMTSSVLITGGTGSFGRALLRNLTQSPEVERIVIYSRDELKQWELQQIYPQDKFPNLRFFLGDVRDKDRLRRAMEGIETVIHAAALKQVPAAEYNPIEYIKTNVLGSENIVESAIDSGVKTVVALSTDKAAAPINLYGATKLCSDKLFIAANNIKGSRNLRFSVVRYGNVMGSRGSVIPFFIEQAAKYKKLSITNKAMTRFNLTLQKAVELVLFVMEKGLGGEIFVPKIPSYRITDLATAIGPSCETLYTGIRPGEKIHEVMITSSDSYSTYVCGDNYIILPPDNKYKNLYLNNSIEINPVDHEFEYSSGTNSEFLSVNEIRQLIINHVNPNFKPF